MARGGLNKDRVAAGRKVVNALGSFDGRGSLGEHLVETYMGIPGRGDEFDLRATAVDVMAEVSHYAAKDGIAFQDIVDGVDGAEPGDHSRVFAAMRDLLEAKGHSYEDALWSVSNHLGVELQSTNAPSLK